MLRRLLVLSLVCAALPSFAVGAPAVQAPAKPYTAFMDQSAVDVAKVLPAPPKAGSLAAEADIEAVRLAEAWRTPEIVAWARKVDANDMFNVSDVLGDWFRRESLPECVRLLQGVDRDVQKVTDRAKKLYQRPRPYVVDPSIKVCVTIPTNFSYPSGHSSHIFARALVLAEVFPERRSELLAWAHRAAWGRIQGGVHFPTDDVGGRLLAEASVAAMKRSPVFQAAVAACRQEAEAVKKSVVKP